MFLFLKRKKQLSITDIRQKIDSLVENNFLIEDIKLSQNGQVIVVLQPLHQGQGLAEKHHEIEKSVAGIKGIQKAMVIVTAQKQSTPHNSTPHNSTPHNSNPHNSNPHPNLPPQGGKERSSVPDLPPFVIAVASGKGGVGKSTVAVNLAVALSQMGKKIGILDADIYGPSLPRLLGVQNKKAEQDADGKLQPIDSHGLKAMSMGFLVNEDAAMIWRGPMLQSALLQMLRDVDWSGLDMLVIDMPPGTGDIHLTLAQRVSLSGGVVVSTPQDIALIDARRGLDMFQKTSVPILGIVENMSYYCCPECGHRDNIFGHGGAKVEADKIGVPFLGEIPLHSVIRQMSDAGTPVTLSATESDHAKAFKMIAERVLSRLSAAQRPAPTIRIEE